MEAQPLEYMLDSEEKGDDESIVVAPRRRSKSRSRKRRRKEEEEEEEDEETVRAKETVPPTPEGSLHSQSQPLLEPTQQRTKTGHMSSATKKALADLLVESHDGDALHRSASEVAEADGSQPLFSQLRKVPYRRSGSTESELNKAAAAMANEAQRQVSIPRPSEPIPGYTKGRDPVSSLPRATNSGGETQEAEFLSDNESDGNAGRAYCETGETSRFAPGQVDHADARGGSKFYPESSEQGTTQIPPGESVRPRVSLSAEVEAEIGRRGRRESSAERAAPTFSVQMHHEGADGDTVVPPHDHFLTLLGVLREQERTIVFLEARLRELEQERKGSRVW